MGRSPAPNDSFATGRGRARLTWALAALFVVLAGLAPAPAGAVRYSNREEFPIGPQPSSIVIDAKTGAVLQGDGADELRYPASLTKMMTLYLTFEAVRKGVLKPDSRITFSDNAAAQSPSKLGVRAGQSISTRDAVYALVTKSANDVAVAVAEVLGGSEAAFADKMTAKARALGMRNTRFRNASGLPDPDQLTTARDMAILGQALWRDFPAYYRLFSTQQFSFRNSVFRNHNRMLGQYEGLDGIKTGYIQASGFNLVSSASRGGTRLIGVVFGGKTARSRDRAMAQLLDESFASIGVAGSGATIALRPPADPVIGGSPSESGSARSRDDDDEPRARPAKPSPGANWAIQVGAYVKRADAERHALKVTSLAPRHLSHRRSVIDAIKIKGKIHYRVRFMGFGQRSADAACDSLRSRSVKCFILNPWQVAKLEASRRQAAKSTGNAKVARRDD